MRSGISPDRTEGDLPLSAAPGGVAASGTVVRIGMIAGSGRLPLLFAQALKRRNQERLRQPDPEGAGCVELVVAAHEGETDPDLAGLVERLVWVRLGQFKRIIAFLTDQGVTGVVMAGGITKARLWNIRPDALALRMLPKLRHLHDDHLLRTAAGILEEHGIRLLSVTDFMPELLAPPGLLSRRAPTPGQWADIRFGWRMAKELGRLDIGQGVVVRQKVVAAVEAMEGTDAMIRRAGPLVTGRGWGGSDGAVLVKVAKPGQDRRLDLPTIGPDTVDNLHRAGIPVLAVEAGSAMILDPEATCERADRHGLVLIACTEADLDAAGPRHG